MTSILDLATTNLLSPMVLFFALGLGAALARSDLSMPEAVAKFLALYLMMAIGFKGGVEVSRTGIHGGMVLALLAGVALSLILPLLAYGFLRLTTRLSAIDAAAVSAHYGSISVVTLVAASQTLSLLAIPYEGYMVAVAAVMEAPAILSALLLLRLTGGQPRSGAESFPALLRETSLNGAIVMLIGSFVIGGITGNRGLTMIAPLIIDPFRGFLCLFLLDMGLVAGRGMREGRKHLSIPVMVFGLYMPLVGAACAVMLAPLLGLSTGGKALLITLAASSSYIAVPAAMRLALPEARPSIYLTLSLGITFPFNLSLGIPLYIWLAQSMTR